MIELKDKKLQLFRASHLGNVDNSGMKSAVSFKYNIIYRTSLVLNVGKSKVLRNLYYNCVIRTNASHSSNPVRKKDIHNLGVVQGVCGVWLLCLGRYPRLVPPDARLYVCLRKRNVGTYSELYLACRYGLSFGWYVSPPASPSRNLDGLLIL